MRNDIIEKITPKLYFLISALLVIVVGCKDFEYSPYDVDIPDNPLTSTGRNIEVLQTGIEASPDSFTFAFITDSHTDYDEFNDAVKSINRNKDILFVIHGGDMTDYGLAKEYEWSAEIIEDINVPCFTVIGNHDCLSNGKHLYSRMFGETFYTFELPVAGLPPYKFVVLNDNTLEYDYKEKELAALKEWTDAVFSDYKYYSGLIVAAQVPPYSDVYFDDEFESYYSTQMASHGVILSLHGHQHKFKIGHYYGDNVLYVMGDDLGDRNYCLITVYPKENNRIAVVREYY